MLSSQPYVQRFSPLGAIGVHSMQSLEAEWRRVVLIYWNKSSPLLPRVTTKVKRSSIWFLMHSIYTIR